MTQPPTSGSASPETSGTSRQSLPAGAAHGFAGFFHLAHERFDVRGQFDFRLCESSNHSIGVKKLKDTCDNAEFRLSMKMKEISDSSGKQ